MSIQSILQIVMLIVGLTLFTCHYVSKAAVKNNKLDRLNIFKGDDETDKRKSLDNYNKALDGILVISVALATFSGTALLVGVNGVNLSYKSMMMIQGVLALIVLVLASVAIGSLLPSDDIKDEKDKKAAGDAKAGLVTILLLSITATCVGAQQGIMDAKKLAYGFDFAF